MLGKISKYTNWIRIYVKKNFYNNNKSDSYGKMVPTRVAKICIYARINDTNLINFCI
jgi:hypothetical protein